MQHIGGFTHVAEPQLFRAAVSVVESVSSEVMEAVGC
jgi:hypothetical protein